MAFRHFIVLLLSVLSMTHSALAAPKTVRRCAEMGQGQSYAEMVGYTLRKTRWRGESFDDDSSVVVEPRLVGLRGPSVKFAGRDVRLAVRQHQTSPQELWHKAEWNAERVESCTPAPLNSWARVKHAAYGMIGLEAEAGFTNYTPSVLYRSRIVLDGQWTRPYGLTFGGSIAVPVADNTEVLLYNPDPRPPVRRDAARFSEGVGIERAYVAWRGTPVTDVHVAVTGGMIEEMYAGAGAEMVWRPFGSPFWLGADGWQTWRRDPATEFNAGLSDQRKFTGQVRAGYDVPDSQVTFTVAAGQFLGGDKGAHVGARQAFENGWAIDAGVTWTDRDEDEGFFSDTHFDPQVRLTVPLGRLRQGRVKLHQVGRDGGQMLDRPQPLEQLTEAFAARSIARDWTRMFE